MTYWFSALSFTEFKKRVSCSIFTNLDACQVSGSRDAVPLVPLLAPVSLPIGPPARTRGSSVACDRAILIVFLPLIGKFFVNTYLPLGRVQKINDTRVGIFVSGCHSRFLICHDT